MPLLVSRRASLFVAALTAAASLPAFAHAHPKSMVPAADATVSSPPELSIEFSEALEPKFSKLEISDGKGAPVTKQTATLDPADPKHLMLALPKLSPGMYRVHWVSAATDGHRMDGSYSFTVR